LKVVPDSIRLSWTSLPIRLAISSKTKAPRPVVSLVGLRFAKLLRLLCLKPLILIFCTFVGFASFGNLRYILRFYMFFINSNFEFFILYLIFVFI